MKFAVIDTETTGLFDFAQPADAPGQPRLASLGIVMIDDDLREIAEHEFLIKPDGWEMGAEAGSVNGLSTERLLADGEPVAVVLGRYTTLIEQGFVIASYNCQYDSKIMRGELRRAGLPDLFERTPNVCLMRASTDVCRVPKKSGFGFKFPKLSEACSFFKIKQPAAHSALGDARSAVSVLRELKRLGKLPDPEVHYAKNSPSRTAPAPTPAPAGSGAPAAQAGDRRRSNGVELEFNGRQWLPVVNPTNSPRLFDADGSRKVVSP